MTLVTAWIRNLGTYNELVVASDSRLSGGETWDCCPKILPLSRGDAVLCFSGATYRAYPIMLQLRTAVDMHPKLRTRAVDITELKGHLLRIIEDMFSRVADLPDGQKRADPAEIGLILAGYSWRSQEFKIWSLEYIKSGDRLSFRRASSHRNRMAGTKKFHFIGDAAHDARVCLQKLLRTRGALTTGGLDMEPFEILRDMIRAGSHRTVGGPPQIVKLYPHMNCLQIGVLWPDKQSGQRTFMGRPLLPYERDFSLALDPDTLELKEQYAWL